MLDSDENLLQGLQIDAVSLCIHDFSSLFLIL